MTMHKNSPAWTLSRLLGVAAMLAFGLPACEIAGPDGTSNRDGDAEDDVTYEFRFRTQVRNPDTFLYNTGPITSLTDADWNIRQSYSVTRVDRSGRRVLAEGLPTPPVNIGPRSTPNYDALASAAVSQLPGGIKVFAGQRDDPFFVDLGSVFDLAGLRPFNPFHVIPLGAAAGVDGVRGYNTHTIAIQVPTAQLAAFGRPTIGVYASASRQKLSIIRDDGQMRVGVGVSPWLGAIVVPHYTYTYVVGDDPIKEAGVYLKLPLCTGCKRSDGDGWDFDDDD